MLQESIEKLKNSFNELLANNQLATQDAVNELTEKVEALKSHVFQKQSNKHVAVRILAAMKMWNVFLKIKKFEFQLKNLKTEALKNSKVIFIDKTIRELQRKGFLLPVAKERCVEGFMATLAEMRAIGCKSAFCFYVACVEEGILELLVCSDSGELSGHSVQADKLGDLQVLLQQKAPSSIPLSQLQDIAGWLHNHGAIHAPMLGHDTIEQKLEGLMKSCPHGAYVLHAQNKALTLSRLSPKGQIEHLIINLQKELGCYTIERGGADIAATRTQFKRRLEQMGTPIRLVLNNKT